MNGEHQHVNTATYGQKQNTFSKWSTIVGFLIIISFNVAGFSYVRASQPDNGGRVVLCTGIIANTANVARDDPVVIDVCREVGVDRANYPETKT